ncbi:hypothetical protein F750_5682 [Streptomyces sp. PAMC 26508]|nr:hypothetical protein F750_5682 [Streptomyces sp. PAMC 26508]
MKCHEEGSPRHSLWGDWPSAGRSPGAGSKHCSIDAPRSRTSCSRHAVGKLSPHKTDAVHFIQDKTSDRLPSIRTYLSSGRVNLP